MPGRRLNVLLSPSARPACFDPGREDKDNGSSVVAKKQRQGRHAAQAQKQRNAWPLQDLSLSSLVVFP